MVPRPKSQMRMTDDVINRYYAGKNNDWVYPKNLEGDKRKEKIDN